MIPTLRDRDQDNWVGNCAQTYGGGWWHSGGLSLPNNGCFDIRLTGQHTETKTHIDYKQIFYYHGGERGSTSDSWAEAEMVLVPN